MSVERFGWAGGEIEPERTPARKPAVRLPASKIKDLSALNETAGGAPVPPARQTGSPLPPSRVRRRSGRVLLSILNKSLPISNYFVKDQRGGESYFSECPRDDQGHCKPSGEGDEQADKENAVDKKPDKKAPGSQLDMATKKKLKQMGMVGSLPPADVPRDAVKIADLSQGEDVLRYKALMSWDQKTKSGRVSRQYRYTQEFHDRNAAEKHDRVAAISPHIQAIAKGLFARMRDGELTEKQREAAAIASVIRETGLRPTDGEESVRHGHFGISSLQGRHLQAVGDEIHLDFIGKEGVRNRAVIREPGNVEFLRNALQSTEPEQFVFKAANSDDAGAILKDLSRKNGGPEDIKIKDLRTLKAHQIARQAVKNFQGPPPPLSGNEKKDAKAVKAAILQMATQVSNVLNNKPEESRDTYVHPEIWKQWQQSLLADV